MFRDYKDIPVENPTKETWKRLRYYLSVPLVTEKICEFHPTSKKDKQSDNIQKQAEQLGYCIRQAEEYFYASTQVSLPTRPNLLYYGAVSLTRALTLLKLDGTFSFDSLRNSEAKDSEKKTTRRSNSHGLQLKMGLTSPIKADISPEGFFTNLACSLDLIGDEPIGHFAMFYRSVNPGEISITIKSTELGTGSDVYSRGNVLKECYDKPSIKSLATRKFTLWDIIKTLPELHNHLAYLGFQSSLCKGSVTIDDTKMYELADKGKRLTGNSQMMNCFLNGIAGKQKEALIELYSQKLPDLKFMSDFGNSLHFLWDTHSVSLIEGFAAPYTPPIVDDITGQKYYILQPDDYLPETVSQFMMLYCLGMLCRYHPDIWMRILSRDALIEELCDSILNIIHRKFPTLILDQLELTKHHIHV